MLNNDDANQIAATIYKKLGGNKFGVMTGAKNLIAYNDNDGGMSFKLPKFAGVKVNYVKIMLNGSDLYNVTFSRIYANKLTVISEFKDIYNDELRNLFESETGLATSL